uniref:Uncharacterized protein n=1 Tax=Anopheles albimanus TaxID=7167 RepID=A0A182FRX4_ANOAL
MIAPGKASSSISTLQMLTGTSAAGMKLELYRDNKLLNTVVDSDEHHPTRWQITPCVMECAFM